MTRRETPRSQPSPASEPRQQPDVFAPGLLLADRYRLEGLIGSGAMGTVWRATHMLLGHEVAIKLLHGNVAQTPDLSARFTKEAKLCARLGEACEHIARVIDYGVLPSAVPFVVMELLKGEELQAKLRREERLPLSVAFEITEQLGRALHVAHRAGVVHRDLKPANVFLCVPKEGRQGLLVKLLDFGIAKASLENEDSQATRAGTILGTPGYMSPEQITGEAELDARSDLWSLAVLVYRMTVGRTPFRSGSVQELGVRILSTDPVWPSVLAPDLPPAFDGWMQKALAKKREDRFQTAEEMVVALGHLLGDREGSLIHPSAFAPGMREDPSLVPAAETVVRKKAAIAALPAPIRFRRAAPLLACAGVLLGAWGLHHALRPVPAAPVTAASANTSSRLSPETSQANASSATRSALAPTSVASAVGLNNEHPTLPSLSSAEQARAPGDLPGRASELFPTGSGSPRSASEDAGSKALPARRSSAPARPRAEPAAPASRSLAKEADDSWQKKNEL